MFIFNFHFQIIIFQFASLEHPLSERTPLSSLSAPGSTELVPGRLVPRPSPIPTHTPPRPSPILFVGEGEVLCIWKCKAGVGAQLRGWSLASALTTPGGVGVCEQSQTLFFELVAAACGYELGVSQIPTERLNRHSLHSLLSHLAHTVASTVE